MTLQQGIRAGLMIQGLENVDQSFYWYLCQQELFYWMLERMCLRQATLVEYIPWYSIATLKTVLCNPITSWESPNQNQLYLLKIEAKMTPNARALVLQIFVV